MSTDNRYRYYKLRTLYDEIARLVSVITDEPARAGDDKFVSECYRLRDAIGNLCEGVWSQYRPAAREETADETP